jgi:hypothetical protein
MYAALTPATIKPIKLPTAHKNILKSPFFSPATFIALRNENTAPVKPRSVSVLKTIVNMRSSLAIVVQPLQDTKSRSAVFLFILVGGSEEWQAGRCGCTSDDVEGVASPKGSFGRGTRNTYHDAVCLQPHNEDL